MPRKKEETLALADSEPEADDEGNATAEISDVDTAQISADDHIEDLVKETDNDSAVETTLDTNADFFVEGEPDAGDITGDAAANDTVAAEPQEKKKRATRKKADPPPEPDDKVDVHEDADGGPEPLPPALRPEDAKPVPARKKNILDLDLNALDRGLPAEARKEWSAIYASFRAKSIMTGTVVGVDLNTFDVLNLETNQVEKTTLSSLVIIGYRVKIIIPETEMWMPGAERPPHVLRNMAGGTIDYVIMEIDREGECAIGSRRMALAAKRHFFKNARGGHQEGDWLKCQVAVTGARRCTVECNGYDIQLSQRDLSYTAIADLRTKFRPGQELDCILKSYDRETDSLSVSVKEAETNPFIGADNRHPVGSRRSATISGKYAGGVFCTLPDDTVCLCLYSTQHSDYDFNTGDSVIIVIRRYDYSRQLIFGRILSKW